ncbi:MAG: hypothetical protein AB4372_13355 [Xenococcus sp. (in: cyanobacteria)]
MTILRGNNPDSENTKRFIIFFAEALENYSDARREELSDSDHQKIVQIYMSIKARRTLIDSEINEITEIMGSDIIEKCKELASKRVGIGGFLKRLVDAGISFDFSEEDEEI